MTADGFFKTGDVMVVDENGSLTVVDRKKELIKYKGLQGTRLCFSSNNSP